MKLVAGGRNVKALVFDLDNTLYTNPAYAQFQEDALIERLGRELGIGAEGAAAKIEALRADRLARGLGKTSLGKLLQAVGIDEVTGVRWREECFEPKEWLSPDSSLDQALDRLESDFALALLTNNPRLVGEKSLEALGVRARFSIIVGLDDTFCGKPSPEPFKATMKKLGMEAESCLSIGDRHDVDLVPAMALGMAAVLVTGVQDVYALPESLAAWGIGPRH